jgi:hypothetical protein
VSLEGIRRRVRDGTATLADAARLLDEVDRLRRAAAAEAPRQEAIRGGPSAHRGPVQARRLRSPEGVR